MSRRSHSRRRALRRLVCAIASTVVGVLFIAVAAPASALPPPPPNPSDSQLNGATSQKDQVAAQVQQLSAQLAQAQAQLAQMESQLQVAQELYNKAVVDLQLAQEKAAQTKTDVATADAQVADAEVKVAAFARSSYIHGSTLDSDIVLLSADGPSQLVEQAGFLDALAQQNSSALDELKVAKVAKANADSAARLAVNEMSSAEANAKQAKSDAESSVAQSQTAMAQAQASKAQTEAALQAAQAQLADLQGQRAQYNTWLEQKKAEEAAAAAAAARAAAAAKAAAAASAANSAAAAAAAAAANAASAASAASSASSASSGGPSYTPASGPTSSVGGGGWSPGKGQAAANAALQWLGTIYAWGGGTASGPSRGVSDGGVADSYGDYNKVGFDCSGLALYAWAQVGISLSHYSGYQYKSGSVHPSINQLMPGDLLFWGIYGIHHVAIYIGNGQVVHAPQSGDVVKVSKIWMSDYVGATRPGT